MELGQNLCLRLLYLLADCQTEKTAVNLNFWAHHFAVPSLCLGLIFLPLGDCSQYFGFLLWSVLLFGFSIPPLASCFVEGLLMGILSKHVRKQNCCHPERLPLTTVSFACHTIIAHLSHLVCWHSLLPPFLSCQPSYSWSTCSVQWGLSLPLNLE